MKLICLNTWGGRQGTDVINFFKKHKDVDIFLLQEIAHNALNSKSDINAQLFAHIAEALPNHQGFFAASINEMWGQALFVRKDIQVGKAETIFVHGSVESFVPGDWSTMGRVLQVAELLLPNGKKIVVGNVHGLWVKDNKIDTESRIQQSNKIITALKSFSDEIILAGDFNLRPETESIKMIESELGLKNMIKEYAIKSTRTPLYTKNDETFADFMFVSPTIKVKEFKVLPDVVSDHAALYLEWEV